jgi:hypothetical protein
MKKNTLVIDTVDKVYKSYSSSTRYGLKKILITMAKMANIRCVLRQAVSFLLLATVLFFSLPGSLPAAEGPAALLEDITFHQESSTRETVTFKLNGPHIPKIFALKGDTPKVVFDFYDTKQSLSIKGVIKSKGNLISAIRTGMHTNPQLKTRVTLDLVPAGDYDFAQDFQIQDNALVITIFHAQPKAEKLQGGTTREKTKKTEPLSAKTDLLPETVKKELPPAPPVEKKKIEPPPVTPPAGPPATAAKKPAPSSLPLAINTISFTQNPEKGEQISFQVTDFHPPVIFGVEEGTPSIICDFLNASLGDKVPELIPANGKFVKQIRVEKNIKSHKIRVILELMPNRHYDLQQVFFKEEHLYVLFIKSQDRSQNRTTTKKSDKP